MSADRSQIRVPFLDLKAQYALIRRDILRCFEDVLDSGNFVGGQYVARFEECFANYVGVRHAIATGSGTGALELVLRALGLGPGDEVIVPANSFFATAEVVSLVGARPIFADVDARTFHLDANSVEASITPATRAIIPVHLYGRAMALSDIETIASRCGLHIIEDACQAHGASVNGVRVGASGRATCFSFYPGKNLGAYGDGGAITCNDSHLANTLRMLRDHGSPHKYKHLCVGTNSRLDALQAGCLLIKVGHLDRWNGQRRENARSYMDSLPEDVVVSPFGENNEHVFHLFVIRSRQRDALRHFLSSRGIETGIHYPTPLHLTPAYQALGYPGAGSLPIAEKLADEVLSLPMYPELTSEQLREVVSCIQDFFQTNYDTPTPALQNVGDVASQAMA